MSAPPKPSMRLAAFAFDEGVLGALPPGWKTEGTQQRGPLATWEVRAEADAPSRPNALTLTKTNHASGGTFNLCWTDRVRFEDGRVEVALRANGGEADQGGGPIWRVLDKDNYYVCRANPLENNVRVYYVVHGSRTELASADATLPSHQWHTIAVEQHGDHIVCFLNGAKLLEATDHHLPRPGGVGVWTKADAATSFDDLEVTQ
ncbi:MAG: DUF1080 domain-containing protein [Planctomycetes bacterium]|nr:DUF1080 domain-containing protein [Planctomycetota bacterium]